MSQQHQQHQQQRSKNSQNWKDDKEREIATLGPRVFEDAKSFEAAMGNKPIFSRAMIEQAAKDIERFRNGGPPTGEENIHIPHLLGEGANKIKIASSPSPAVSINWNHTFIFSENGGKISPYHIWYGDGSFHGKSLSQAEMLKPDDPDHPLRERVACWPDPPELEEAKRFQDLLLASPFWAHMQKELDSLKFEVKNIVCMGLGVLFWDYWDPEASNLKHGDWMQHLTACVISKYLTQRYHDASPSSASSSSYIPIVAFDPSYDIRALHILSRFSPPITVISDPYQYLSINTNTLTIAIAVPVYVPIYEIAADLCFPSGPAAMLCNEIDEFPYHEEGKMMNLDQRPPRVGKMLELFDAKWLGRPEDDDCEQKPGLKGLGWGQNAFFYVRKE